ncbi:hypothetical protein A2U01_0053467, partial [Trifolium medium]|nr:hypothetical protein [Trifolium medium]
MSGETYMRVLSTNTSSSTIGSSEDN